MFLNIAVSALQQGLCYALVALGVYISYKILDFPDLSVDSTFPLGAVISVIFIAKFQLDPLLSILLAMAGGAAAGALTGLLHVKLRISNLLSGIIVMTAFLSINKAISKIYQGTVKTIISYGSSKTIFSFGLISLFPGEAKKFGVLIILLLFVAAFKILLDLLLKTKVGFMLRATGKNEQMVTSLGKDVGVYKIIGLAVANALVAMGGAVYSQWNNYYDGQSGQGMVVIALASVIIGCSIFKNAKHIKGTTSAIIGAIIYGICLYLATFIIDSMYLKLIMAALFTIVLAVNTFLLKDKKTSLRFNIKETAKK